MDMEDDDAIWNDDAGAATATISASWTMTILEVEIILRTYSEGLMNVLWYDFED